MDVVFVGTFPPQACGIAEYTYDLAQALLDAGHGVTIAAESTSVSGRPVAERIGGVAVWRVWNRRSAYEAPFGLGELIKFLDSSPKKPDVVHIQHEFGIFREAAGLRCFVEALNTRGVHAVITLHTVEPEPKHVGLRDMLGHTSITTIVHTALQAAMIADFHTEAVLIPHGCPVVDNTPAVAPEGVRVLCPGFLSPSKNHMEILRGVALFARNDPSYGFHLTIAGSEPNGRGYLDGIENSIRIYGIEDYVTLSPRYVSRDDLHALMTSHDCVVLGGHVDPKRELVTYSASGQVHQALGYSLPILAKNLPIYHDGASMLWHDAQELAACFHVIGDSRLAKTLSRQSRLLADTRRWPQIAAQHAEIYAR